MNRRELLAPGSPGSAPALLERRRELAAVTATLERAVAGVGGVLVVDGEAGIGKTALIATAMAIAGQLGMRVLTARGAALEREFAYGVLRQLYEGVLVRLAAGERRVLLQGAAAHAGSALGFGQDAGARAPPDAAFAIQHGTYWLNANLASGAPLLLAVDDAQWADVASLRCLAYLAHRLEDVPIAVLVGWRAGEPGAEDALLHAIAAEPAADRLLLEPLSAAGSATLVRRLLDPDADERLCGVCHHRTRGNPFLLNELAHALDAEGADDAQARLRLAERLRPHGIRQSLLLRLSRQPPQATALARAIAVLDSDAEPRHVAALAELAPDETADLAGTLIASGVLVPGPTLQFAHPILRAVVYDDTPRPARSILHRRAAALLVAEGATERAAVHLLSAEPVGDRRTVDLLRAAARAGLDRGAPDAAAALLERALTEPPAADERATVVWELGHAAMLAGKPSATAHLREALALAAAPGLRAAIARELGGLLAGAGRGEEALDFLVALSDEIGHDDPGLALGVEADAAVVAQVSGRLRERHAPRLAAVAARASGDCPGGRRLLVAYAYSRVAANAASAAEIGELLARTGNVFADEESWAAQSSSIPWAIGCEIATDRLDDAVAHASAEVERGRARGAPLALLIAGYLARVAYVRADLVAAERDALIALQAAEAIALPYYLDWPLSQLALVLVERGAPAEAEALLDAHGFAGETLPRGLFAGHFLAEARIAAWLALGRTERAALDAEALWRMGRGRGSSPLLATRGLPALALHAAGQSERARELAAVEVEAADRWGLPSGRATARRVAGVVTGGASGLDLLVRAARELEQAPRRIELIRALVDLGTALRLARRPTDAREPLRRALDLAAAGAAGALAERARVELRLCGARPRRDAISGRDALTAAERRVAELVAAGEGNVQVAQALYITRRTVETHLSSVYRKLGVSGRGQLAQALDNAR